MPAEVKRTEGSAGISEEEGTILCPFLSKKSKKAWRNFTESILCKSVSYG